MISFLAYTIANKKEIVKDDKPTTKRMGAVLIKAKRPDRARMDKRLKSNKDDISIEELC